MYDPNLVNGAISKLGGQYRVPGGAQQMVPPGAAAQAVPPTAAGGFGSRAAGMVQGAAGVLQGPPQQAPLGGPNPYAQQGQQQAASDEAKRARMSSIASLVAGFFTGGAATAAKYGTTAAGMAKANAANKG